MKYHKMEGEEIYEAVNAESIQSEMEKLLKYINEDNGENSFLKAAVAFLWFVLIHPFEDGNGRISRAVADYIINRDYSFSMPLLSVSTGILRDRATYYEKIQSVSESNSMDISGWIIWFLDMVRGCFSLAGNAEKDSFCDIVHEIFRPEQIQFKRDEYALQTIRRLVLRQDYN